MACENDVTGGLALPASGPPDGLRPECPAALPVGADTSSILDGLPRAVIVTKPDGRIVLWNRRATELYGWTVEEVVGRDVLEVLVPAPDQTRATEIRDSVRAGEAWEGDFTVVRKDGARVRVWVSDRPILDGDGAVVALVAASEDVTERRLMEQREADLTENLRLALEAGELGTFRWDMATGATEWDGKVEALFGLEPGAFDGTFEAWVELLHPEDREATLRTVNAAVAAKESYTIEHRVVWPDGSVHWLHGAGQVTVDADGQVTGTIGCTRDITQQVLADRQREQLIVDAVQAAEQERISRERLEFLGSINDALASSRNRREVMVNVARAAVPRLGDWCSVFVLPTPTARIPEVETAHVDPEMVAYAQRLQEQFPYDPDAQVGMPHVIRTGTSEFYQAIDERVLAQLDASEPAREVAGDLVLHSSIAVPLVKRGRVLGGLQLVMTESRRRYTADDLALTQAVAARIASSLENLRLSEEQRSIASTLQASLLPRSLPDIPGIEIAVRYWANGEGIDVGGDFYDAFSIGDDRWAVVIGDVCGTGPAAAAVTGLARHTIASAAWHGDDESTVLRTLNRALAARDADRFCTAAYGTVRPIDGGAVFTFATAGHPLPIVARADGTASDFGTHGPLLGVFDDIEVTTSTTVLEPGDSLLLYTDGVTDVAPPYGLTPDEATDIVARAAASTLTAEELADRLQAELTSILPIAARNDDTALLILRVTPR
jgi:PAS domain S-box-containing protein